jgi:hypothetical protein
MAAESDRVTPGKEVRLRGNPDQWFVVVAVEGDLLRLAAGSASP